MPQTGSMVSLMSLGPYSILPTLADQGRSPGLYVAQLGSDHVTAVRVLPPGSVQGCLILSLKGLPTNFPSDARVAHT